MRDSLTAAGDAHDWPAAALADNGAVYTSRFTGGRNGFEDLRSGGRDHFRLRYDATDGRGAMTLRRGGRLHHLKVGAVHARRRVLAIVDEREVTVVALDTGEVLSSHRIEPDKGYWRNQRRDPGRWPGSQRTS
jgi:hypothetical protein